MLRAEIRERRRVKPEGVKIIQVFFFAQLVKINFKIFISVGYFLF